MFEVIVQRGLQSRTFPAGENPRSGTGPEPAVLGGLPFGSAQNPRSGRLSLVLSPTSLGGVRRLPVEEKEKCKVVVSQSRRCARFNSRECTSIGLVTSREPPAQATGGVGKDEAWCLELGRPVAVIRASIVRSTLLLS